MNKPLVVKDITMVAVLSSILVVLNNFYLFVMPFIFLVYIISLKKWHVYMISLITSAVIFVLGTASYGFFNIPSLSNFIFLPLMAAVIYALYPYIYVEKNEDACSTVKTKTNKGVLTLAFFVMLFVNGAVSQLAAEILVYGRIVFEPTGWLIHLGLTVFNTILVYVLAFPLRRRLCKLLRNFGI